MLLMDFENKNIGTLKLIYKILMDRGHSAVFLYRLSNLCLRKKFKLLSKLIAQLNIFINHCDIAPSAEIGKGLTIFHAIGIVIVAKAVIGKNFCIYQNVTIGKNIKTNDDGRAYPVIGDNVNIFTGAVVGGPIIIGDNVNIGANSVVLKDVPPNKTVIGAKSQFI